MWNVNVKFMTAFQIKLALSGKTLGFLFFTFFLYHSLKVGHPLTTPEIPCVLCAYCMTV